MKNWILYLPHLVQNDHDLSSPAIQSPMYAMPTKRGILRSLKKRRANNQQNGVWEF
jgi:hypothetical protein